MPKLKTIALDNVSYLVHHEEGNCRESIRKIRRGSYRNVHCDRSVTRRLLEKSGRLDDFLSGDIVYLD